MGGNFFQWVRADSDVMQQYQNCWKLCSLLGPPEATSFDFARQVDSCELEEGWCEMSAGLRGCEPGIRGMSNVARRYPAAQ
jgi:hypothetical protein